MTSRLNQLVTLVVIVLALGACASTPQLSVKDRWNRSILNLSLVPIYPMMEQVYIGDLRLFVDDASPYSLASRYVGHVDGIEDALLKNERRLPSYSRTSIVPNPPSGEQPETVLTFPDEDLALLRLRKAAIPTVKLVRISDAELGGSVKSEATVDLSLTSIETIEIDDISAYALTKEYLTDQSNSDAFRSGICAASATLGDPAAARSKIAVVTRVFYARGIKYVYEHRAGAALPALPQRDSISETGEMEVESKNSDEPNISNDPAAEKGKASQAGIHLSEFLSLPVPGIVARFSTSTQDTITLEEVYERPMAFGVDVMIFHPRDFGLECADVDLTVAERSSTTALRAPAGR